MEIRGILAADREQLCKLILDVYRDSVLAMWFEREPGQEELNELFAYKLKAMRDKMAVDLVAIESGRVIGECEIMIKDGTCSVGVIVDKQSRSRGIGTKLLSDALGVARSMGVGSAVAEIADSNFGAQSFFRKNGFVEKGIASRTIKRQGKTHRVLYFERDLSAR